MPQNNECRDSKFKLCFKLKQATPIIHFQANQSGATLRATELKPKFDRFLKEYVFGNDFEKYKEFLIGYKKQKSMTKKDFDGKEAFDYKVKIVNSGANEFSKPKAYVNPKKVTDSSIYQAPYFADEHRSILSKKISIEFFTFNSELKNKIEEYFDKFLLYNNFGTRQNKGFGSFVSSKLNENNIVSILKEYKYPVFQLVGKFEDYQKAFKAIDIFYKKLKAGLNQPYYKSLLFRYICDNYNIGWEKKFIKNKFPTVIYGTHSPITCNDNEDKEFRYIRAVLGLAEHNEYRPPAGKKQVRIESVEKDEHKKPKYQRFKSPITFKIIGQNVYLLYDESYRDILDKEFYFKLDGDKHKLKVLKEFDMYDFLKYVEEKTNYIQEV